MIAQLFQSKLPRRLRPFDVDEGSLTEEKMIVLMLNETGLILNCNSVAGNILGCMTSQLLWQPITGILPKLTGTILMENGEINTRLRFLSRIGHLFEVISPNGESFPSRLFFNAVDNLGRQTLCVLIRPEALAT